MGNALYPNLVLFNSGEYFHAIWALTRTKLAAGWRYLACGNGQSSGATNIIPSGTTATISAFGSNVQTLTGLSLLTQGVVGQLITISNAATSGNNGTFLVLSVVSASSLTVYNTTGTNTDTNNGSIHWQFLRNSNQDLWGVGGAVHLTNVSGGGSGSGTGVSIGAATAATGQAVITGVSSFSQNLSPGRFFTITGSATLTTAGNTTYSNNGTYRIVAVNAAGTSVTVYAPHLVAETNTSALSVVEQYGGADGTIGSFSTVTTGVSYLLNFTTSSFNSFSALDVGRRITIFNAASVVNNSSFIIVSVVSSNHVLLSHPTGVANDTPVGTIQWVEWDPLLQTYPASLQAANGSGAWEVLGGPTIMRIPIGSNVPTGTFIRGENVTQTTTGAQGELLGVITDASGGNGYLVVAPRVGGTGVQASPIATFGWNNTANTDTVTGAFSGATVTTPVSSTPIAYIREMVFWKNTAASGHIYYECIDQSSTTESATTASTGRFSTMANTLSQVTPQVCPGGSAGAPTANGFPVLGTMAALGTGGSGAAGTGSAQWPNGTSATVLTSPGRAHLLVANNLEQQGVSADGTWTYMQSASSNGYACLTFQRCDNQEDGDVDPYITSSFGGAYGFNSGAVNPSRTVNAGGAGGFNVTDNLNTNPGWWTTGTQSEVFRGFRRRGLTNETFATFAGALIWTQSYSQGAIWTSPGYPDEVATAPVTTAVREPVWLIAGNGNTGTIVPPRMRKGTPRWLMLTFGVSSNQTLDGSRWISASSSGAPFIFGPWDGSTIPTF